MMEQQHLPVLLDEAVDALAVKEGGVYVDATFGAGGYSRSIAKAANCTVYGFDRDPTAIARARPLEDELAGRLKLIERPFADLESALAERGVSEIDGVVFDIGVSSMQFDEADRGFSFRADGPLSMRMDGDKPDAADVIAAGDAQNLAKIFRAYGEEKRAGALARAIVKAREAAPIKTTAALADIIEDASPMSAAMKIHPATRVFQALRIFVNDELGQLVTALHAAERILKPAGRLVVVTFHSLEDRIVKRFFANRIAQQDIGSRHTPPKASVDASFSLAFPKAKTPGAEEIERNPRARSAKLRCGVRLAAPAIASSKAALGAPDLFSLADFFRMQKGQAI